MKKLFVILLAFFMLQGCEILEQVLQQAAQTNVAPTDSEIVQGLKKALELGTDYAVTSLNKTNGYYGNPKVKIPLPEDAQVVFDYALNNSKVKALGLDAKLQEKIDNFVLAVNRSAEGAAIQAKPIFVDAVTDLSISQGMNILKGQDLSGKVSGFDSIAASHYLEYKTRSQLFGLFKPKMDVYLDKDMGVGFSANEAWNTVTTYYNSYIATILGKEKITYTLSDYATNEALDGVFYMMGQEEKKIRQDPYKFAYDIIKKVFGYVK